MIQQTLFGETDTGRPLASRMRPRTLEEFAGQRHLLGEGKVLRQLIDGDRVPSMVFWGPPGVGKTTLARIIANRTKANFIDFSAVTSGIKEIKEVMQTAEANRRFGEQTILFVDEIHRFNKAQQDAFLPFVEKGSIILIGATTENPSFEINSALLSRCKVFVLHGLSAGELTELLRRALTDPRGFGGRRVELAEGMLEMIANFANGDARTALNTLEMVVLNGDILPDGSTVVPMETLEQCISKKSLLYDKHGEEHYNLISALHKSMRNSDPDAAVYWLARMLEAGEDPLYVARRLVRFASEDVGLADSRALEICVAAYQACHFLGMPECTVHLTHAAVYLSAAPKSNALYKAYETAKKDALEMLDEPVPLVIRNAPTRLMKELHYGEGYQYAHDAQDKLTDMQCLPDSLQGRHYYVPTEQGREGRRDALAGKCRCALCGGKLQSKYGRAGKYLRCRTHAVAPERCPGVSIRRDEAAQCVLEALQACMARYLDREYLARHLRPPEAAAHRQEQLALRAARLEQALARQRACRKTLYEDRVDGAVTAAQFAELSAAFEAEIARLGKELAAAERERGAAVEQAAQCVTAEQLVEKYARADVLTDEMAECMVEAVLVGRPERQRRPVPLEIRWRF